MKIAWEELSHLFLPAGYFFPQVGCYLKLGLSLFVGCYLKRLLCLFVGSYFFIVKASVIVSTASRGNFGWHRLASAAAASSTVAKERFVLFAASADAHTSIVNGRGPSPRLRTPRGRGGMLRLTEVGGADLFPLTNFYRWLRAPWLAATGRPTRSTSCNSSAA